MSNAFRILGPLPACVQFVAPMPGRFRIVGALRQVEIAALFGVSQQAVDISEKRAFRKLRKKHGLELMGLLNDGKGTAKPDPADLRDAA